MSTACYQRWKANGKPFSAFSWTRRSRPRNLQRADAGSRVYDELEGEERLVVEIAYERE